MKFKILACIIILFQGHVAYAFSFSEFFGNIFTVKAGSKATDSAEGKDIEKFKKSGRCRNLYPWSEPKIKDPELLKRMLFVCRSSFYIQYDPLIKMPVSVSEVLTKDNMLLSELPKTTIYEADTDLPTSLQASLSDYEGSYYEIGALAPTADMIIYDASLGDELLVSINKKARRESLFLSNTAPQVGNNFRRGIWAELEAEVRNWTIKTDTLYVTTGPLFLGGQVKSYLGLSKIPVPTHFYKLITDPSNYGSVAYIIPNKEIITSRSKTMNPKEAFYCGEKAGKRLCELNDFTVSIKELEKLTGLEFYPILAPYYAVQVKQDINQIFKDVKKKPNLN